MSHTAAALMVLLWLALQPVIAATTNRLRPPAAVRGVVPPDVCPTCRGPLTPGHTCTSYTPEEGNR